MRKSLLILLLAAILPYSSPASGAPSGSRDYVAANKLFASQRYQEALTLYKKILAESSEDSLPNDIYSRIGDTYFRVGSYEDALMAYRVALKDRNGSRNAENQYWVGICCMLLGRDEEAVSEFLKVPRQYPRAGMWVSTSYYWAGRASERLGKTDDAAAYYKKAAGSGKSTEGAYARRKAEAVKRP